MCIRDSVSSHHQTADDVGACRDESEQKDQIALTAVADLHDVSILHDVFLAFETKQAFLLQSLMAAVLDEVVIVAHLGANKVLLKVGVNHSGRTLRIRP